MLRRHTESAAAEPGAGAIDAGAAAGPALDPLTGLLAREELVEVLREWYKRAEHDNKRFAVLFIRLDDMRDLNDLYGPDDAELALRTAADRLRAALGDELPLGRWAGAELCLAWPDVSTPDGVQRIARELIALLAEPVQLSTTNLPLRCRIGASLFDAAYESQRAMVADAHDALVDAAERSDREPEVRDESTRNRLMLHVDRARLEDALTRSEFRLVWQPIVSLGDRSAIGVEALLRWEDSRSGTHLVPPGEFLALLERTGMIVEVGAWVLHEACRQVKVWNDQRQGQAPLLASVNLGGRQIQDPGFAERVVDALETSGLPPELLCLDLTDAALAVAGHDTWGLVRPLKMLGVQLALDGLGTGSTAIEYLRELQLDMVRIDRLFIADIATSPDDQTIVRALLQLGSGLGLRSVAQGVETEEQVMALLEMGCDLAQGYLFGRPMLAEELGVPS